MGLDVAGEKFEPVTTPATLGGLAIALFVLPLLSTLPSDLVDAALVGDAIKWVVAGVVVAIVVRFEGRDLASIGVERPRFVDLGWALLLAVAAVLTFVVTDPLVEALGLPPASGLPTTSLAIGLVGAVTAGVTEEVLFRGYPIERFVDAGFDPPVAGAITWALFTVAHAWSGYSAGNLVQIALAAAVITLVSLRTRSLFPVVLGHVLTDVVGVLAFLYA